MLPTCVSTTASAKPLACALFLIAINAVSAAPIPITAVTSDPRWTAIGTASSNSMDFFADRQTGIADGEIIGNSSSPGFFYSFDDGGTTSPGDGANFQKDGTMTFRVRMSGDENPAGFTRVVFVGIDLNNNGSIEMFVGVDHQSPDRIAIWRGDPNESNLGPSTTGVENPALLSYVKSTIGAAAYGQMFNWTPVATIDSLPVGSALRNIDNANGDDYYVTFRIDFADFVAQAASIGHTVNDSSPLRFILATSNQPNALNIDLGGVNGGLNTNDDNVTWSSLGAFTSSLTSNPNPYQPPVDTPEPTTFTLIGLGLCGIWRLSNRRG